MMEEMLSYSQFSQCAGNRVIIWSMAARLVLSFEMPAGSCFSLSNGTEEEPGCIVQGSKTRSRHGLNEEDRVHGQQWKRKAREQPEKSREADFKVNPHMNHPHLKPSDEDLFPPEGLLRFDAGDAGHDSSGKAKVMELRL